MPPCVLFEVTTPPLPEPTVVLLPPPAEATEFPPVPDPTAEPHEAEPSDDRDLQNPRVCPAGFTHSCGSPGGLWPEMSLAASLAI